MFAEFISNRIRKLLSFIGLRNISLIHLRNILQAWPLLFQQICKGDQKFLPYMKYKVMRQTKSFCSKVNGIPGKGTIYDRFPDLARLAGIGHQGICRENKSFLTIFTAVYLFVAFMAIADDCFFRKLCYNVGWFCSSFNCHIWTISLYVIPHDSTLFFF